MPNNNTKVKTNETTDRLMANIRYIIEKMSLTQVDFATTTKVKRQTIGAWLEGRGLPSTIQLEKISLAYKVSIDQLVRTDLSKISGTRRKAHFYYVQTLLTEEQN